MAQSITQALTSDWIDRNMRMYGVADIDEWNAACAIAQPTNPSVLTWSSPD